MKRRWFLFALLAACTPAPSLPAATTLPDVTLRSTGGAPAPMRELVHGRVAVIDLWATWCAACRDGFPRLERLSLAYAGTDFVVIGVDVGEEGADAAAYAKALGATYDIVQDPEYHLADQLGALRLPTVLVIGHDGAIAYRGDAFDQHALDVVRSLLAR